jgi:hypothetical protein
MSSRKRRKRKTFRAAKEVRRLARRRLGTPPPSQRIESPKRKPPKHKKLESEGDLGEP